MGKEMKAREDNRDVFEKVMDYATPAAGAYAGAVVTGRLGKKIGQLSRRKEYAQWRNSFKDGGWPKSADHDALEAWAKAGAAGQVTGLSIGGPSGLIAGLALRDSTKKRRK